MLETLNDILLSTFLFVLYFSLFSSMFYSNGEDIQTNTPICDYKTAFSEEYDREPATQTNNSSQDKVERLEQNNVEEEQDLISLFKKLKQSHLRKLCNPMGIKPRKEGKWLPTSVMRSVLQEKAEQTPDLFLQALHENIPTFAEVIKV